MFAASNSRAARLPMKKIGIVGGVAWPSTVDYYAGLCRLAEQQHAKRRLFGAPTMPEICIESLDLARVLSCMGAEGDEASWARFDACHHAALRRLEASGADLALIASNTPHHRFDAIVRGVSIPVINIIDASAEECVRIGARRVLLLGTALTMRSPVFRERFADYGIHAFGPGNETVISKTTELIADLQRGRLNGAVDRLKRIVKLSAGQCGEHPVICLACTELPLVFQKLRKCASFACEGVRYINSSVCHIRAAFAYAASHR